MNVELTNDDSNNTGLETPKSFKFLRDRACLISAWNRGGHSGLDRVGVGWVLPNFAMCESTIRHSISSAQAPLEHGPSPSVMLETWWGSNFHNLSIKDSSTKPSLGTDIPVF